MAYGGMKHLDAPCLLTLPSHLRPRRSEGVRYMSIAHLTQFWGPLAAAYHPCRKSLDIDSEFSVSPRDGCISTPKNP